MTDNLRALRSVSPAYVRVRQDQEAARVEQEWDEEFRRIRRETAEHFGLMDCYEVLPSGEVRRLETGGTIRRTLGERVMDWLFPGGNGR